MDDDSTAISSDGAGTEAVIESKDGLVHPSINHSIHKDDRIYTVFHAVNEAATLLGDESQSSTADEGYVSERPTPVRSYSDAEVATEMSWLDRYTAAGSSWRRIRDRVSLTKAAPQRRARQNRSGLADRFLSTFPSTLQNVTSDDRRDGAVADASRSLMDEVIDESILAVCSELVDTIHRAWEAINSNCIVHAVVGLSDKNNRFLRISGREHLAMGLLSDRRWHLQLQQTTPPLVVKDARWAPGVDIDVRSARISMPTMKKSKPSSTASSSPSTSGGLASLDSDRWLPGATLKAAEVDYWKQMEVHPVAAGDPLQCPSGWGCPTAVRLFTPGKAVDGKGGASSILVCVEMSHTIDTSSMVGTSLGMIVFWSIPQMARDDATVLAMGGPDDDEVPSAIVDIQCGSMGLTQFVTTSAGGTVRVWHLNDSLDSAANDGLRSGYVWAGGRAICSMLTLNRWHLAAALPAKQRPPPEQTYDDSDYVDQQEVERVDISAVVASSAGMKDSIIAEPSIACFHPSITLLGRHVSVLMGTAGGTIVKFNMDNIGASMKADVVYPMPPFIDREYLHPSEGPPGFLLTGCVDEKRLLRGNRVYREVMRGHCDRVISLGTLHGLSDTVLSVDKAGTLCEWQYSPKHFRGANWFSPSQMTRMQLSRTDLLPFDLSSRVVCASPCVHLYPQINDFQHDGNAADDQTVGPVRQEIHADPAADAMAVSRSAVDATAGLSDGSAASAPLITISGNEVDPQAAKKDVSLPPPSEEQRMRLRVMEVSPMGPDRGIRTVFHPLYSAAHQCWIQYSSIDRGVASKEHWENACILQEVHLDCSLLSCKPSLDGDELFMLLSASCSGDGRRVSGDALDQSKESAITVYYIESYVVKYRGFPRPFCRLLFQGDNDRVLDFCVGPVTAETLTRMCFVLTRLRVEVFGIYTGQRLHSIEWTHMEVSFRPNRIAVCPSQQVLAVSAADDERIAVWRISLDVKDDGDHADAVRRCEEYFGPDSPFDVRSLLQHATPTARVATDTILPQVSGVGGDSRDRGWIMAHVWDRVSERIDELERHRHLSSLVQSSNADTGLGMIEPTAWPCPQRPTSSGDDHAVADDEISEIASADISPSVNDPSMATHPSEGVLATVPLWGCNEWLDCGKASPWGPTRATTGCLSIASSTRSTKTPLASL